MKRNKNMKFRKILLLLIIPFLILVSGCKDNTLNKISKELNTYTMDIKYNKYMRS